jgi:hypothetical protein
MLCWRSKETFSVTAASAFIFINIIDKITTLPNIFIWYFAKAALIGATKFCLNLFKMRQICKQLINSSRKPDALRRTACFGVKIVPAFAPKSASPRAENWFHNKSIKILLNVIPITFACPQTHHV